MSERPEQPEQPGQSEQTPTPLTETFRSLKRDPMGRCFTNLGADGVLRIYHSDSFEVIDAARLSPIQIKNYLDRLPFEQAREDKFRGVDGRGVPDEHLFNVPEEIRPERPSEEFVKKHRQMVKERNRRLAETDSKTVCKGGLRSNYNLDPI